MVEMDDFRKEDGFIDWKAYKEAQINAGEICSQCEKYMFFGAKTSRRLCGSCMALDNDTDEVSHDNLIRCPKCKYTWNPWECEDYPDGSEEMDVQCGECDHDFTVGVQTSYSFTSPELELDEVIDD